MKPLSRKNFSNISLEGAASFHGMKLKEFISEVYPASVFLKESEHFYMAYIRWCIMKTPLGKLI